jgi:hypothetical protein
MKVIVRLMLLAALAGLGYWLYTVFFPGPEKVIRHRLAKLAQVASIRPDQGLLSRGAAIQELAGYFDSEIEITVNWRGGSQQSLAGRDEILETAKLAHARFKHLKIEFLDLSVTLAPDKQSATVHLTAKVTSSDQSDFQVQELKFHLRKVNGDWLIFKIETIRTLSRVQARDVLVDAAVVGQRASRLSGQSSVAQISNLLYRRIAFGSASLLAKPPELAAPCGLQIRDTGESSSALRRNVRLVDARA